MKLQKNLTLKFEKYYFLMVLSTENIVDKLVSMVYLGTNVWFFQTCP